MVVGLAEGLNSVGSCVVGTGVGASEGLGVGTGVGGTVGDTVGAGVGENVPTLTDVAVALDMSRRRRPDTSVAIAFTMP